MNNIATPVTVGRGLEIDLQAINEIYNYYVESSYATFETNCWTLQQRKKWLKEFNDRREKYNLFVAKVQDEVVGFAYNAKFKEKPAYQTSSEVTVYVRQEFEGHGVASVLYEALFKAIDAQTLNRLYAVIALPNDASIHLHEKFGFKVAGLLHDVGYKHGKFHSTAILEKRLQE